MNWPTAVLGDVAVVIRNGIFAKRPSDQTSQDSSRILRISAVRGGQVNLRESKFVEGLTPDQVAKFSVDPGDLLITRYNGSRSLVGSAGIVPNHIGSVIHPDKLIRVVVDKDRVLPSFINYQLQSESVRRHLEPRIRTTAGQSGIAGADVKSIPLVVPSLDDQQRIVEILEDHLSRLDKANGELSGSLVKVETLRRAALHFALQTARSEPASVSLTIGEIAQVTSGMTPLRSNPDFYVGGDVPWITSGDLHQKRISGATQYVTRHAVEQTSLRVIPAGAILVAMYGEGRTRGTSAFLDIDATTNQACAAIQLHDIGLRRWVQVVLEENYDRMRRLSSGGVQPNLNLSLVRGIEVVIPREEFRAEVLTELDQISEGIARLRSALESARRRSDSLRRALLSAAFSGRLVTDKTIEVLAEEPILVS